MARYPNTVFIELYSVLSYDHLKPSTWKQSYICLCPLLCRPQPMQAIYGKGQLNASNNWTPYNNAVLVTNKDVLRLPGMIPLSKLMGHWKVQLMRHTVRLPNTGPATRMDPRWWKTPNRTTKENLAFNCKRRSSWTWNQLVSSPQKSRKPQKL